MNLEEKLKKQQYNEIWQQYCGFLDLSMNGYMKIQRRLMEEQVKLWSNCGLGQSILKGKHPQNLDEFRKMVPLTTYDDYADILLAKQPDMLPGNPVIWIQTTWEGGKHPIKVAPYTRSMLDTYRNNVTACLILSTSKEKGSFDVAATDKFLYALAPLPFATGLFPLALGEEIGIEFLPAWKRSLCSKLESFFANKRRWSKTVKPYAMQATYDITSAAGKASLQKRKPRNASKRSFPSKRIHGSRHR